MERAGVQKQNPDAALKLDFASLYVSSIGEGAHTIAQTLIVNIAAHDLRNGPTEKTIQFQQRRLG